LRFSRIGHSVWYFDNVAVFGRRLSGMTLLPGGDYDFLKGLHVR